jgi:hypothetical protein
MTDDDSSVLAQPSTSDSEEAPPSETLPQRAPAKEWHDRASESPAGKHAALLKESMLGLFYPAVLGAIAYYALDAMLGSLRPFVLQRRFPRIADFDAATAYRALLYVLTFTFYCCDYFYLRFTNTYRKLFFAFDVVFVVGLYETATLIEAHDPSGIPDVTAILFWFTAFMILYLVWDVIECREAVRTGAPDRTIYTWVLGWEAGSLLLLGSAWVGVSRNVVGAVALAVVLALVDIGFVITDIKKKRYCRTLPA